MPEDTTYSGAGTITMKAAGSAHVGNASGPFSNTSSQKIELEGSGSNITLSVNVGGHTYKFKGTIRGEK